MARNSKSQMRKLSSTISASLLYSLSSKFLISNPFLPSANELFKENFVILEQHWLSGFCLLALFEISSPFAGRRKRFPTSLLSSLLLGVSVIGDADHWTENCMGGDFTAA